MEEKEAIIQWINSIHGDNVSLKELTNGFRINEYLDSILGRFSCIDVSRVNEEKIWESILVRLSTFYFNEFHLREKKEDVLSIFECRVNIKRIINEQDIDEVVKVLQLVLCASVHCTNKTRFIEDICKLPEKYQSELTNIINKVVEIYGLKFGNSRPRIIFQEQSSVSIGEYSTEEQLYERIENLQFTIDEIQEKLKQSYEETRRVQDEKDEILEVVKSIENELNRRCEQNKELQKHLQEQREQNRMFIINQEGSAEFTNPYQQLNSELRIELLAKEQTIADLRKHVAELSKDVFSNRQLREEVENLKNTAKLVHEMEFKLKSFEHQSDTTERLKKQIKEIQEENAAYISEKCRLEETHKSLLSKLTKYKQQILHLSTKDAQNMSSFTDQDRVIINLRTQLEIISVENAKFQETIKTLENERDEQSNLIQSLMNSTSTAVQEYDTIFSAEYREKIIKLESENKRLLESRLTEEHTHLINDLKDDLGLKDSLIQRLKEERDNICQQFNKVKEEINSLKELKEKYESEINQLCQRVNQTTKENDTLSQQFVLANQEIIKLSERHNIERTTLQQRIKDTNDLLEKNTAQFEAQLSDIQETNKREKIDSKHEMDQLHKKYHHEISLLEATWLNEKKQLVEEHERLFGEAERRAKEGVARLTKKVNDLGTEKKEITKKVKELSDIITEKESLVDLYHKELIEFKEKYNLEKNELSRQITQLTEEWNKSKENCNELIVEIEKLKTQHNHHITRLTKEYKREKEQLIFEHQGELVKTITDKEDLFENKRKDLQQLHQREKEEIFSKFLKEKKELLQTHHQQQEEYAQRIQKEHEELLDKHRQECDLILQSHLSEKSEYLRISDEKLRQLTDQYKRDKDDLLQKINHQHHQEMEEMKQECELLQRKKEELTLNLQNITNEKARMIKLLQTDKDELLQKTLLEKEELIATFTNEKVELGKKHNLDLQQLKVMLQSEFEGTCKELENKHHMNLSEKKQQFESEIESLTQRIKDIDTHAKKDTAELKQSKEELERVLSLKEAQFEKEKQKLELDITNLINSLTEYEKNLLLEKQDKEHISQLSVMEKNQLLLKVKDLETKLKQDAEVNNLVRLEKDKIISENSSTIQRLINEKNILTQQHNEIITERNYLKQKLAEDQKENAETCKGWMIRTEKQGQLLEEEKRVSRNAIIAAEKEKQLKEDILKQLSDVQDQLVSANNEIQVLKQREIQLKEDSERQIRQNAVDLKRKWHETMQRHTEMTKSYTATTNDLTKKQEIAHQTIIRLNKEKRDLLEELERTKLLTMDTEKLIENRVIEILEQEKKKLHIQYQEKVSQLEDDNRKNKELYEKISQVDDLLKMEQQYQEEILKKQNSNCITLGDENLNINDKKFSKNLNPSVLSKSEIKTPLKVLESTEKRNRASKNTEQPTPSRLTESIDKKPLKNIGPNIPSTNSTPTVRKPVITSRPRTSLREQALAERPPDQLTLQPKKNT